MKVSSFGYYTLVLWICSSLWLCTNKYDIVAFGHDIAQRGNTMNDPKVSKLQYLLIKQLLKEGSIELILPDGVRLEIGITQEDQFGDLHKTENYCYVVASRDDKSVMLDSFNLGLQYAPEKDTIICEDELLDDDGRLLHLLDVV